MSIPFGYKHNNNMAFYPYFSLQESYLKDYGENLERKYDCAEKTLYRERVFCLDCFDYKKCQGRCWIACPYRARAMKIIRG